MSYNPLRQSNGLCAYRWYQTKMLVIMSGIGLLQARHKCLNISLYATQRIGIAANKIFILIRLYGYYYLQPKPLRHTMLNCAQRMNLTYTAV